MRHEDKTPRDNRGPGLRGADGDHGQGQSGPGARGETDMLTWQEGGGVPDQGTCDNEPGEMELGERPGDTGGPPN